METKQLIKPFSLFVLAAAGASAFYIYAKRKQKIEPQTEPETKLKPEVDPTAKNYGEGTRDIVEEASWESFPASDPPAW